MQSHGSKEKQIQLQPPKLFGVQEIKISTNRDEGVKPESSTRTETDPGQTEDRTQPWTTSLWAVWASSSADTTSSLQRSV